MQYTSKLPNLQTSIFAVMSRLSSKYNAVNLSQGFPNFKSDEKLIDLASKAMKDGYNQYAPMLGDIDLRQGISDKYKLLYKSTYNPENEIVITAGATQAIYAIISAFIGPDDEVLVFKPAYDCYEPAITINGGRSVAIQLNTPDYQVDWQEVASKITSKTKMIIINTPQNPCGTIFSKDDMLQLERITSNTNIIVLSDEVYEHMIFDNEEHQSVCRFPELKKRSLITGSFGKTFHNTGWKMGYCCGPDILTKEFLKVHQFNVFCVNHPFQKALAIYLKDSSNYNNLPQFFQQKRDYFLSLIKDSRFTYIPTKATYFQLLNYENISKEHDVDFAKQLITEFGIASIPLSVFNQNNRNDNVLRFCFAKTDKTLEKAAKILNKI